MVAGYTAAQVRAAEAPHLAAGEPLMQLAATALADVVRDVLAERRGTTRRVLLVVGPGDNGGDALFAGARLAGEGAEVWVVPTGSRIHAEGRAAAESAGATFLEWDASSPGPVVRAAAAAEVVVDGILGTGTSTGSPALRGAAREIVAALGPVVEASGASVVAVDLPSGIHPDTGAVPDPTVLRAAVTVTFGAAKAGLLIEPGVDYAGRLVIVDLGLGPELAAFTPVPGGSRRIVDSTVLGPTICHDSPPKRGRFSTS